MDFGLLSGLGWRACSAGGTVLSDQIIVINFFLDQIEGSDEGSEVAVDADIGTSLGHLDGQQVLAVPGLGLLHGAPWLVSAGGCSGSFQQ